MFKEMSKFQLILIGLFCFFSIGGLVAFSVYKGNTNKKVPTTTIWGTMDRAAFSNYIFRIEQASKNTINIRYIEKNPETFDDELVEALAINRGPDAILISQDSLLKQINKIIPVAYKTLPEATFKSTYIEEAELFLTSKGVLAIPFAIDPMVMYWNRTIFTNAGISLPPKYWDQFVTSLVEDLTIKDQAGNLTQSAVALGEYANINHAKDIVTTLMMQAGNPLVTLGTTGYQSTLNASFNSNVLPSDGALTFYTQFADARKDVYSWNRAQDSAKDVFLADKLGIYFGYASEYSELRERNPNLNFDVALMPQPRPERGSQPIMLTNGRIYGFSMLKSSRDQVATYNAITMLTSKANLTYWAKVSGWPAVRRDALVDDPSDAASTIFAQSALMARSWLDPDDSATNTIYKNLIESVTSGRLLYNEAIFDAQMRLRNLLEAVNKRI